MTTPFVMLVDDEVPFVETMAKRLQAREIHILQAFSGKECLEKARSNADLEVIILDVKMPGMDGIETLREMKKMFPLIEVIMLTGHASIELAIEGMKLGAFDFLMKPCDINKLIQKIE